MTTPTSSGEPTTSRQWGTFIAMIVMAGLLLTMPLPMSGRPMQVLCDLTHGPLFALLTWGSLRWWERSRMQPQWLGWWLIPLGLFTFGAVAEWAQGFVGRGTSWGDAKANLCGVVAGGLAYWAYQTPRAARWQRWLCIAVATAALLLSWIRVVLPWNGWGSGWFS